MLKISGFRVGFEPQSHKATKGDPGGDRSQCLGAVVVKTTVTHECTPIATNSCSGHSPSASQEPDFLISTSLSPRPSRMGAASLRPYGSYSWFAPIRVYRCAFVGHNPSRHQGPLSRFPCGLCALLLLDRHPGFSSLDSDSLLPAPFSVLSAPYPLPATHYFRAIPAAARPRGVAGSGHTSPRAADYGSPAPAPRPVRRRRPAARRSRRRPCVRPGCRWVRRPG